MDTGTATLVSLWTVNLWPLMYMEGSRVGGGGWGLVTVFNCRSVSLWPLLNLIFLHLSCLKWPCCLILIWCHLWLGTRSPRLWMICIYMYSLLHTHTHTHTHTRTRTCTHTHNTHTHTNTLTISAPLSFKLMHVLTAGKEKLLFEPVPYWQSMLWWWSCEVAVLCQQITGRHLSTNLHVQPM